jgi:hypothetical protein
MTVNSCDIEVIGFETLEKEVISSGMSRSMKMTEAFQE